MIDEGNISALVSTSYAVVATLQFASVYTHWGHAQTCGVLVNALANELSILEPSSLLIGAVSRLDIAKQIP